MWTKKIGTCLLTLGMSAILAACPADDQEAEVSEPTTTAPTTTQTTAPTITATTPSIPTTLPPIGTVEVGQFCDDKQEGDKGITANGQPVTCEFNPNSNRNQWVSDSLLCPLLPHPFHHLPCPQLPSEGGPD